MLFRGPAAPQASTTAPPHAKHFTLPHIDTTDRELVGQRAAAELQGGVGVAHRQTPTSAIASAAPVSMAACPEELLARKLTLAANPQHSKAASTACSARFMTSKFRLDNLDSAHPLLDLDRN